ncbi:M61 family metallopeptidase [Novosphingobium flavum]|uniref:M61 family metallopeptidase n=1 Tax=Novosphingobium flavum TaxID=1778672 RepID=A0A7X1KL24_9SPHN|nr:M61 family metallopeptidase [Novosphingobium flavum]MBC2665097.1 M61 family metallopeptidase [Novosphingobium flavum]
MKTRALLTPLLSATLLGAAFPAPAPAQSPPRPLPPRALPQAVPIVREVPEARDLPYPGTIALSIDATDTLRALYKVTETIPVAPGTTRLTLLLPEWHPGKHSPAGTMAEIADLRFFAGERLLTWRRDPVDTFAFHVDVPAGTAAVTARFIHTSPIQPSEGRVTMSPELLNLQWTAITLYPAGHYIRQIRVKPEVTFPAGWTVFTALDGVQESAAPAGKRVTWAETDYEELTDSPIFAGINAARFDLGNRISLDVVADEAKFLELPPVGLAAYRALAAEALLLYGSRHFDHYDILLGLTDKIGGVGLEHLRSSENTMEQTALSDWAGMSWTRNVIPHELSHSWDGKYRRPARLWTPDYRTPMQDDLLWVYEGQNQFWGYVLAARSGVQSREVMLGTLATVAAGLAGMPGRGWRSVADTTADPIFASRKPKPWASLARGEDYYTEGALVWLEADQLIREGTRGKKGLDDFAKAFFGVNDGQQGQLTYEFEDVVAALNDVYPYDWATFLKTRIDQPGRPAPLAGIERGGYRLTWREEPNAFDKGRFTQSRGLSLTWSLGLALDKDGKVVACQWGSPCFDAGVVNGVKVTAVNGAAYSADALRGAVTAAKTGKAPIQLLVQRGERYQTVSIDYHGGLRYPWLERNGTGPAGLDALLAPRRTGP